MIIILSCPITFEVIRTDTLPAAPKQTRCKPVLYYKRFFPFSVLIRVQIYYALN